MADEFGIGMIVGCVMGLFFGAFLTGIIIDDGFRQVMEQETLDEICTELSGETSEYNMEETTRHKLICNPGEDEIVLDHGAIVLRGYEDPSQMHNKEQDK